MFALSYIVCFLCYYVHDSIVYITDCFIALLHHVRRQSALCCQINV